MLQKNQQLAENTLDLSAVAKKPTRDGFGEGLCMAGDKDPNVVALCADLAESTRVHWFREKFPTRYIEMGVAEQNLICVASGMAAFNKIPFVASYAAFNPGRNLEQIRTTVALNEMPVKIVGAHAGISVGPDGATHQALEDIAQMRVIPNMTVIMPADAIEAKKATMQTAQYSGPVYLRLTREKTPVFTQEQSFFEIGKANVLWDEDEIDVAIMACGPLVHTALLVANELLSDGVKVAVLNVHTIKPLDTKLVTMYAQRAGAVVTVEEHQTTGGLGSAIAEHLVKEYPVPMEFIGVTDKFGQSGTPDELYKHYNMNVDSIKTAVKKVWGRK